jgi:hypothetical protein
MPSNPNTRRTVKGGAFAFIFISAMGFASSARAETVTLSCEGEIGPSQPVQLSWTIEIDYATRTVKWAVPYRWTGWVLPAIITDREITFSYLDSDMEAGGRLDRLAGTMNAYLNYVRTGERHSFQGRCRPATTRF